MEFSKEVKFEMAASKIFGIKITIFFHFRKSARKDRSYYIKYYKYVLYVEYIILGGGSFS
jgi:hypothetical protein